MGSNEETNAAGTDTRPPMLVESDYDSWKIRIHRYIRGKPNGKLIWKSIQNGPTPHPMITDPPPTDSTVVPAPRKKLDSEFSEEENKLEMADTQAEIILSQGLPRHIFNNLNQTSTAKEIWDNVELLMQGSGRTLQQRKEDLFDEYERFRAIGNESIHDYFVRFHKLVNDMKITQLNIPTHQMNTKFVNNLPAYWGKYVTNVKQNMDISTTPYVQIYTHLKAYEPHAKKTLKKQEQSTSIVDPLAYVAHTTTAPVLPSPSTSSPQPTAQSPNDALMATMTQIANLLSGFQKQFPPTNNQLRTSSNSRTHATVHDGHIVTEPVQRKAPGVEGQKTNKGNGDYVKQKLAEGEKGGACCSWQLEEKGEGDVLDAEAEAFLADVECTAPYDQPQALTTTNMFQANHEDAYDSDVDEGPNAAVAFMANLSSTSATNNPVNEVHSNDNQIFDNVDYQLNQEMHQVEHLDSDAETEIDDNTIPYHQYLLDTEAQNVPTKVSADTSDKNVTVSSCSNSNIQEKTQLSRSRCMHSLKEIKSLFKFLSETLQDYGTMPIFKRTFSQDLDLLEQHLTKDILSRTDCTTTLTNLRTTFENAFKSELKARMQNYTRYDAQSFYDAMIFNMDSLGKYMLESILHQHYEHHNMIIKVDLLSYKTTCSEKEDSNSETASSKLVKECSLNFETKDVHAIKYKMTKAKERCMAYFRSLHSHLQVLSKDDLKGTHIIYKRQLDKDEFQEDGSMAAFWVVNNQFQKFINLKFTLDYNSQMTETYFVEYTGLEVQHFRNTLLQHLGNVKKSVAERTRHQRQYERREDNSIVQDISSRSREIYDADDADIRPIYDEEPMAEVGFEPVPEHVKGNRVQFEKTSNKAKIEKEIDVLETMNIELEHSVATLRKENETLKQHYKDLYDSIKITRSKTTEQTTSLLANNAELKAQIQEKVFAIAALKNDLRKLKGNSVDTKFDKTSVLGKPVLPSLRNQSVVRQPNAFKSLAGLKCQNNGLPPKLM
ncbi:hypothetical protein Tco_0842111 [Tanacetum coccineum]|uniref:Uncharacterized protein n=2 Tax=Tanacetum coccineum TaxID=301880 RepID=A0ABQ5B2P8_9ASTR